MMKFWQTFMAILLLTSQLVQAQNENFYTVQVGTFIDAKPEDFSALRELGFVHAQDLGNNLMEVYVGGFENRPPAEQLAATVRQNGYANAFVQERIIDPNQPAAIVQMATRQINRPVEWENFQKAGPLYGMLEGSLIKIVTGPFTSEAAAQAVLPGIRELGYKDAFVKNVPAGSLLPLTEFETGVKKPLIPLAMNESAPPPSQPESYEQAKGNNRIPKTGNMTQPYGTPTGANEVLEAQQPVIPPTPPTVPKLPSSYDYYSGEVRPNTGTAPAPALPAIDGSVKRGSALDLQRILKASKAYTGSLDGYYGPGTKAGYEKFFAQNRTLQQYQLIAEQSPLPGQEGSNSELQKVINEMGYSAAAAARLDDYKADPLAQAYQAYQLFQNFGPGQEVNQLMNRAIKGAFQGKRLEGVAFDPSFTYAYENNGQLIQHLLFVHAAPATEESAPCWLAARHPAESADAYTSLSPLIGDELKLQGCGQFESWPEVRMLVALAADLSAQTSFDQKRLAQAATERSRLYTAPKPLNDKERASVENWHDNLLKGVSNWSKKDPLTEQLGTAFQAMYFQSQVRLEDYFMDKGYKPKEAKALAVATLHTLVAYHMQRFV
ncbi:MAG: hypothetical protein RIC19_17310 [Phaeodactylibacter sp.]|uniref:hypothetical protein n=1 Tax=Phaeodactylibacter sp. TaxID=1940289 RepID=UPI0032EFEBF5